MGEVYLVEDLRLDRQVAASALNHPNICVVHEVGEAEDRRPYIAMEYVEGDSLEVRMADGPLEIPLIADIAIQIADALDAAHNGRVVHRDIKPGNISLNQRVQVKVLDFKSKPVRIVASQLAFT